MELDEAVAQVLAAIRELESDVRHQLTGSAVEVLSDQLTLTQERIVSGDFAGAVAAMDVIHAGMRNLR